MDNMGFLFRRKQECLCTYSSADSGRGATASVHPLLQATVLSLASLCATLPAVAQDEINIKFAHRFSAGHYAWAEGGRIFVDEVRKLSDGRVDFAVYPAGQLGKDYFSILRSGLSDMAVFLPSYESDKLPLSTVVELPNMYANVCEGANKYWKLAREGGSLGDSEFKKQGLHVLFVTVMPPHTLMTTKKPISDLASMSGLKVRSSGAAMSKTARILGAVPVQISPSEAYEALSRGTVDGAATPYNVLPPYNLEEQLKYAVNGLRLGGASIVYAMSTKKWNKLPADIKEVMSQAAKSTQAHLCEWLDEEDVRVKNHIVEARNHVITELPSEDLAEIRTRLEHVALDWAKDMDAARRNGSEILQEYLSASAEAD
jgi:TRAP-type C4-dicarboxylate transport system substrate-binding protein